MLNLEELICAWPLMFTIITSVEGWKLYSEMCWDYLKETV